MSEHFWPKALEQYLLGHISGEPPVLRELARQTHLRSLQARMVSGHEQGNLLRLLVELSGARNVLEIGTFTGYSAIAMGLGLPPDGRLYTVDRNDEWTAFVDEFIQKAGLAGRVEQRVGRALELIPSEFGGAEFDLVFVDADKREYPDYYRMLLAPENRLVKKGSIILADNTLWYEKVLDPAATDPQTRGIRKFNELVKADSDKGLILSTILPLRDGLTLMRVMQPLG